MGVVSTRCDARGLHAWSDPGSEGMVPNLEDDGRESRSAEDRGRATHKVYSCAGTVTPRAVEPSKRLPRWALAMLAISALF